MIRSFPHRLIRSLPAVLVLGLLGLLALPSLAADPFLRRTPTVRAVEKVGPSVVNITTERVVKGRRPFQPFLGDPFFERFFKDFSEPQMRNRKASLGSGVIIDARGHVLTNEHVVARADVIRVTLADGREFEAELVGADPHNDLAVLRIASEDRLPWIQPGNSSDLLVGEPVIAIGNPFGLSNSVTTGVVSALDRSIKAQNRTYYGFMQTDASINPGNSGGPLLNAEGTLIGINTAVYGGGAQGIGFAIPIDVAHRVMRELIERGEIAPVWLGVELQDLDASLIELMELPDRFRGVLVRQLQKDGPAAQAGLAQGEIVTRIDGLAVANKRAFYDVLERSSVRQGLTLTLWKEGKERDITVRTQEIPEDAIDALAQRRLGVVLRPREQGGFVVESVLGGSGAEEIGVEPGDLIIGINGKNLDDEEGLRRATLDLRGYDRALIVVVRGRGRYHVTLPLS